MLELKKRTVLLLMMNGVQRKDLINLYTEMIEKVKAKIISNELCVVPHTVGKLYGQSKIRLMVVGRAVNGWNEEDYSNFIDSRDIAEHAFKIYDNADFSRIVKMTDKDEYNYIRSKLHKLTYRVLCAFGEGTPGHWYDDPKQWQEKFVSSNLYHISPQAERNPSVRQQKATYKISAEILLKEIEIYNPTHIIFVVGKEWMFDDKWEDHFQYKLGVTFNPTGSKFITSSGYIGNAKYIVTERPERRVSGWTEEFLVNEAINAFNNL